MKAKALLISFVIFASSVVSLSASILDRVFEVRIPVDLSVSNNTFFVDDYMKENLVIDLSEIARNMSEDGFVTKLNVEMDPGFAIHTKKFDFGVNMAPEITGKFQLSKSIFEFIGLGNTNNSRGELFTASANVALDMFFGVNANLVLKGKKFSLGVSPSVFMPLVVVNTNKSVVSVKDVDGKISAEVIADMTMYSCVNLSDIIDSKFDAENLRSELMSEVGADLGISAGYKFSKRLNFDAFVRVPVVPGRVHNSMPLSVKWNWDASFADITNPEIGSFNEPEIVYGNTYATEYTINRPLKANLTATWKPIGNIFNLTASGGLGLRHPFADDSSEMEFYPEYKLGLGLSLFGLLGVDVSTEYTDQLFIHRLGLDVNVRLVEVQVGVSAVGPTMESSMKVGGVGAYALVCIGF